MKKQHFILFVFGAVAVIGIVLVLVHHQKRSPLKHLEEIARIPDSQRHPHVGPDGKIVEHIHTYKPSDTVAFVEKDTDLKDYMKMNRIQRAWAQLDLAEIREKWQPYTIAEMREKWFYKAMVMGKGPDYNYEEACKEIEKEYPLDQWIQRYLDMGYPFHYHFHYRKALGHRKLFSQSVQEVFNDSVERRTRLLGGVGLPPEATWEEYVDTRIKHKVLAELAFDKLHREDPTAGGGVFWVGSGVIPFKSDTVYVHVSDEGPVSHFIGPKLSRKQKDDLTLFGIAPKGMKVVYTDKSGVPLPPDVKPRFYERAIAELVAAEKHVEKLIADHDALFNRAETETGQKAKPIVEETQHKPPHSHKEVPPTHTPQRPDTRRNRPPQVEKNVRPPLPDAPHDPVQIERWFEELILLHGGDLPKDIKALQKAITALKAIREAGEEKIPDAPRRPPEPPAPPKTPSEQ